MIKLWILVCAFVAVLADETTVSTLPPSTDEVERFQKTELLKLLRSFFDEARELKDAQRIKLNDIIKNVSDIVDEYHSNVQKRKLEEVERIKLQIQENCPGQAFNESSVSYCFTTDKILQAEKLKFNDYKSCVYRRIMSNVNNLDELENLINVHSEELEDVVKKMNSVQDNREMKNVSQNVFNTFQSVLSDVERKLDELQQEIGNFFPANPMRQTTSFHSSPYLYPSRLMTVRHSYIEENKVNHYNLLCYTLNSYKHYKTLPFVSYSNCVRDNNRCATNSPIANSNEDLENLESTVGGLDGDMFRVME